MDTSLRADEHTERLWQSFRRELGCTDGSGEASESPALPFTDQDVVLDLAERLLTDWGSNRTDMQKVLMQGVRRGELADGVLQAWEQRLAKHREAAAVACALVEAAGPAVALLRPSRRVQQRLPAGKLGELPPALASHEILIVAHSRKQGSAALEMGRLLRSAQSECARLGHPFEAFLLHLHRRHGINRATCYLNMKYAQWDLPAGLATSVMKWIVQGFAPGSPRAREVVLAAQQEPLTLQELKERFGRWRGTSQTTDGLTPGLRTSLASLASGGRERERLRKRLRKRHQRLCCEIEKIECLLQRLEAPSTTDPADPSDPSESAESSIGERPSQ